MASAASDPAPAPGDPGTLASVTHLRPVPDPKPPPKLHERVEAAPSIAELERWATVLRIECVRMLAVAKSGHLDSSLSAADIVAALYYRVLRHDPENSEWAARDRFVLCKGHAAPIQYAALAQHGYFPLEELMGLRQIGAQLQTDGTTEDVMDIGDVRAKFEAFGWDAIEIDGHDMQQVVEALERSRTLAKPAAIVAQTKKGKGVSSMQDRFGFHGKPPTPEQAAEALEELMSRLDRQSSALHAQAAKTEPIATRHAYGDALTELGEQHEDVVALDADLAVSTQSIKFGKRFPDRFFNVGAAAANMMSIACGLAATGKVPYCSTFAIFAAGRAYDQVRLGIAHNELKIRVGASHGGVSLGEDGASHQMIEDIALMRAMPRMQVVVPADYNQGYRATLESYVRDEPMYMRLGRPATPIVYDELPETLGNGVDVLREGKDISLIAGGHMVWRAIEAAESLEHDDGIEAEVVNVSILKPLDSESVLASLARTKVAVTAEEHRKVGGLADAIREVAAEQYPVPIFSVGVGDRFGLSGTGEAVMERFGLTAEGIADTVRQALALKPVVKHAP